MEFFEGVPVLKDANAAISFHYNEATYRSVNERGEDFVVVVHPAGGELSLLAHDSTSHEVVSELVFSSVTSFRKLRNRHTAPRLPGGVHEEFVKEATALLWFVDGRHP